MYNRYIPQSDGTHRRRPTQEAAKPSSQQPAASAPVSAPAAQGSEHREAHLHSRPRPSLGINEFFRQLLPHGLDIGDLIVVLLLLLMAADGQEEQNSALLTLALYLFL